MKRTERKGKTVKDVTPTTPGNFNKTNIKPEHDVIYVDTFNLFYLRRIFGNPMCGLSGDFLANHVWLAEIKVCSPWQAFLLPSPSQREHHFKLNENIFPGIFSGKL